MLQPINIIINADDLGYHHLRDDAIIKAKQDGILTSASLMVNGKSVISAVKKAKNANLSMVLHLNITEGKPISPVEKIKSLVQEESKYFLGKQGFWEAASCNKIDKQDVITETIAQIEKFKALVGTYPTHVDGHQHAHIANGIPNILAPIFNKYNIKSTRIPREVIASSKAKLFYKEVVRHARIALPIYKSNNITTTSFFIGLRIMGANMTYENIVQTSRETCLREQIMLPNNNNDNNKLRNSNNNNNNRTIELMCHPGISFNDINEIQNGGCGSGIKDDPYDNGVDDFCISKDREIELNTLINVKVKEFLQSENFQLCTWENAFAQHNNNNNNNDDNNYNNNSRQNIINILSDMTPMTGNASTALRWRYILSKWYKVRIIDTRQGNDRSEFLLNTYYEFNSSNTSLVLALNATKSIPFMKNYKHEYVVIAGGTDVNHNLGKCKHVLNQANYIVTFTNVMQNKIREIIDINSKNIVTIPQSVDLLSINAGGRHNNNKNWFRKKFDDNYLNNNNTENDILILLPAGIRPVKDPGYLIDVVNNQTKYIVDNNEVISIDVIKNINHQYMKNKKANRKIKLILIGPNRDDALYESLKSKETNYFKIHPPVQREQMLSAMKEADVVVNTSVSEGMSGAILEAMGVGTPVMARNIPANNALLHKDKVGILFSTPKDFHEKLHHLIINDQDNYVNDLIQRAKDFVNEYSMEKEGLGYLTILESIFDERVNPRNLKKQKV